MLAPLDVVPPEVVQVLEMVEVVAPLQVVEVVEVVAPLEVVYVVAFASSEDTAMQVVLETKRRNPAVLA